MKLFTIASIDDYEIETENNIYLKKVRYLKEDCLRFLLEAKKYYYTSEMESESTDFNDRYSSSYFRYEYINFENIVIKDNKFYGVMVMGADRVSSLKIVCTLDKMKVNYYDGSSYSYINRNFEIIENKDSEEAIEFSYKYYINKNVKIYKILEGNEELESNTDYVNHLISSYVIIDSGKPVGFKYEDREYRLNDDSKVYTYSEIKQYGIKYNYVYTISIEKTKYNFR